MQEAEPLENALRRFKRKVQQEDIIREAKRHSFYLKPGEKRRLKETLARKRNRKKKCAKSRINAVIRVAVHQAARRLESYSRRSFGNS